MISINHFENTYEVHIGSGIFSCINKYIRGKSLIITDTNVATLYLNKLQACIHGESTCLVLTPGESSKCMQTVYSIYDQCSALGLTRYDTIIGLGGGVIGDIAGFAAGTYKRGLGFINVPTTLLAMTDSSIGAKNGINHPLGKNMIGMFYAPLAVICDTAVLSTLPDREFRCGMAEVIKYGCILDEDFFNSLHLDINIQSMIQKCIKLKREIVEKDPLDKQERRVLNFGHTLGHCIETACGYGHVSHGEAVSMGMVLACRIGEKLGKTQEGTAIRLTGLLQKYSLPTDISLKDPFTPLAQDKKCVNGGIDFVFLKKIGSSFIEHTDFDCILGHLS